MSSRWSASRRRPSSRRCSGFAWGICRSISSCDDGPAPSRHHLGITVDDFDAAYQAVKARTSDTWGWQLVELPSRQVQLYFRDPSDNLIELNWPDADTLDRSRYPELRRIADHIPQKPDSEEAVLYLFGGE